MESGDKRSMTLNSTRESKITNVILSLNRAQVTRSYKVNVDTGHTKLKIASLPTDICVETIRVESRGAAVVQDVTTTLEKIKFSDEKLPLWRQLEDKIQKARNTKESCQETLDWLHDYMADPTNKTLSVYDVDEILDMFDMLQEKWGGKVVQAGQEIKKLTEDLNREEDNNRWGGWGSGGWGSDGVGANNCNRLRTNVVVGLDAPGPANVEVVVVYDVLGASWNASYDVLVDMQAPCSPVKLIYKALIIQDTGEDWENVPLTLKATNRTQTYLPLDFGPRIVTHKSKHNKSANAPPIPDDRSFRTLESPPWDPIFPAETNLNMVSAKSRSGNTTFQVPGLVTMHSDNQSAKRCVTIADLDLEAKVSWMCIPDSDRQVHIEGSITNLSQYTLLPGKACVYVDQCFISSIHIPLVVPKDVFKCPLGVDHTVHLTQSPQERKMVTTGFFNKRLTYEFTQKYSIQNANSVPLCGVKVTDYVHVSHDPKISVSLLSPALTLPPASNSGAPEAPSSDKGHLSLPQGAEVEISGGIRAMWKGAAELEGRPDSAAHRNLGKDGKIEWLCDIPAFGRVDLLLHWKVTTTQVKKKIYGI